jgi:hypothetical protein
MTGIANVYSALVDLINAITRLIEVVTDEQESK